MHKFKRTEEPVPLKKLEAECRNNWDTFGKTDNHRQLGDALFEMQHHYCAYCELHLKEKKNGHIEHLERRKDNPNRAFDWKNLFFSCTKHDSCGRYKDENDVQFQVSDIVDPSIDDPADFFRYTPNGTMLPSDAAHTKRATETIRVFNLNSTRLKSVRKGIAQTVELFLEENAGNPSEQIISDFFKQIAGSNCESVYYSILNRKMP